jgi:dolichol-phosphate mannosyltransferase
MPSPSLVDAAGAAVARGPVADRIPVRTGFELTVVVPTFNERDNVALVLAQLEAAPIGIEWEVV